MGLGSHFATTRETLPENKASTEESSVKRWEGHGPDVGTPRPEPDPRCTGTFFDLESSLFHFSQIGLGFCHLRPSLSLLV